MAIRTTSTAFAIFTTTSLGTCWIATLLHMNMITTLMQLFLIKLFLLITSVITLMVWFVTSLDQGMEFRGLVKRL